jgi:hypothetical protein
VIAMEPNITDIKVWDTRRSGMFLRYRHRCTPRVAYESKLRGTVRECSVASDRVHMRRGSHVCVEATARGMRILHGIFRLLSRGINMFIIYE